MAVLSGQRKTFGYGQQTSASDAQNEALDISGALSVLNAFHHPFLAKIGANSLRKPVTNVKHEWLEDEHRGMSATTTDTDLNNTTVQTVTLTLVTSGDYLKFRGAAMSGTSPYDIVRISSTAGSEIAPVLATANNTIDVGRGAITGVTPVDHTNGGTKTIAIIGTAQAQGLTGVGASRTTLKTNVYNYTQIFEDSYSQSQTQRSTAKFVEQDDQAYEWGKIIDNFATMFERSLIDGVKMAPTSSQPSHMGGIKSFITTNSYDKAGAALTQTMLTDALVDIWNAGGTGNVLGLVNATQKRRISLFLDAYRQTNYHDEVLGTTVSRFTTDFGDIDLLLDRNMLDNEVLLVTTENVGFGPLRPLSTSEIVPTSREYRQWEATGEYTAEVRLEKTHGWIKNLATTNLGI